MATVENMKPVENDVDAAVPLVVDLDGTLIRTDCLVESAFALLKKKLTYAFLMPVWLARGKAALKREIAARVDIDVTTLPYHEPLIQFLNEERDAGRPIVLATASNQKYARAIAHHLGLFDEVIASDDTNNYSGRAKLARLETLYGAGGFDYAGNANVDLKVWARAREAIVVNPERGVARRAARTGKVARTFDDREGSVIGRYLKALRLHQWLKNLLVFVPLVMAHEFDDPLLVAQAAVAFLAFGLCASSVYLLNDLLDLPDDRHHPTKRTRPFAAGTISIVNGVALIPLLLGSAFALASMLPIEFVGVLALYYGITLAYSLRLKRSALVDVLTLAGLYTIRIIAGGAAVTVELSFWLLAFSMFLFLSLALVKRFTELLTLQQQDRSESSGRGYTTTDLESLSQFGSASAYMAVLVLSLYINSEDVQTLYSHPELIWLLCPILLYMIMRVWLLARRDELHEDPVVFVIEDRRSQVLAVIAAILLWLAI